MYSKHCRAPNVQIKRMGNTCACIICSSGPQSLWSFIFFLYIYSFLKRQDKGAFLDIGGQKSNLNLYYKNILLTVRSNITKRGSQTFSYYKLLRFSVV